MIATQIDIPHLVKIFRLPIVFYKKRKRKLPTTWADLKLKHFPALEKFFATISQLNEKDISGAALASATLFCQWMNLDPAQAKRKEIIQNPNVQKIGANFLLKPHSKKPFHKRILWMRGPGSQLVNLRFQQFILAETIFDRYRQNPNIKDITLLATITHRSAFLPYWHKLSDMRYWVFRLLPNRTKKRTLFTYIAQRSHLPKRYPELYKQTGSDYKLYVDQQILNQTGVELGNYNDVAAAPVHRVLELMQLKEIQLIKNNPNYAKRNATVEELYARAGYKKQPNWTKR